MTAAWLAGLLRVRTAMILGTIAGIAMTVGLIVSLGAFMQSSAADMTVRATGDVPIDWQIELLPGGYSDTILQEMPSAARIARGTMIGYAASDGFEASAGGTVQTTGP